MIKTALLAAFVLYSLSMLVIFIYSIAQAQLVYLYCKNRKNKVSVPALPAENLLPPVTVQLPVYNELYVVERLIDAVSCFDYPKEKLEIQVLDDSTDETSEIIARKVREWRGMGIDITHIQRTNRTGYKAGALKEGLAMAKGEFIAIFDADFIPAKDFLHKTLPYFQDNKIGMVQTRWDHINQDYSLLTKVQAFMLDAHFSVEQAGRYQGDCFINFNGTAGIWRKSCIVDAGNWEFDTLTEDIDLSYRAQMKDWKFVYLEKVDSPAELPPVMSAFKTQQYRWTKGGAETAKKHFWNMLRSGKSLHVIWHGLVHLFNSSVFISIITCSVLSVPLLLLKPLYPEFHRYFLIVTFFLFSFCVMGILYWYSTLSRLPGPLNATIYFIRNFPLFLSVMMGLSLHNSIAVIEGFLGRKTPFVRTPKFNIKNKKDGWNSNRYISRQINGLTIAEGLLAVYFLLAVVLAFRLGDYALLPFHLMLAFGFGAVFYYSVFQSKKKAVHPDGVVKEGQARNELGANTQGALFQIYHRTNP